MYIETDRLIIKDFVPDDCYNLFKLDNDRDVMRYIASYTGERISLSQCKKIVEHQIRYYKGHPSYGIWPVVLKSNQQFIGWCALRPVPIIRDIEIGYRFMKEFWGLGYATETTSALLDYAFEELNLEYVIAVSMPENTASIRVMEKNGMVFYKNDILYNFYIKEYIITKNAWKRGRITNE